MKLTLQRNLDISKRVTFGKLYIEGIEHPDIYTIELAKKDGGKGYCITQGIYNLVPHNTVNHPNTYQLLNVPGRTAILIHPGNFASNVKLQGSNHQSDTSGCILIGFGIEENVPMITKSKLAMDYLRSVLGKRNHSIEVKD